MKSACRGTLVVNAEVTNVSPNGIWLLLSQRELFLAYADFPWFERATIRQISRVARPSPHHLYWSELDIDLAVDSVHRSEAHPLVSATQPNRRLAPTRRKKRGAREISADG